MKTNLIIVPCHSVWNFSDNCQYNSNFHLGESTDQWSLAPFQYEGNDHISFIKHGLRAIVELLSELESSIVIFSGSQTKSELGPMSEAQSYYFLVQNLIKYYTNNKEEAPNLPSNFDNEILSYLNSISSYLEHQKLSLPDLFQPEYTSTEEFSLDSFDNLLYSIGRFHEIFNRYPNTITIIGFGFKEERFVKYHAKAIDFPESKIKYVSIGPEPTNYSKKQLDEYFSNINKAEGKNALNHFAKDWYGTLTPLVDKKQTRNPYNRIAKYAILDLLKLNKPIHDSEVHFNSFIKGKMPWSL